MEVVYTNEREYRSSKRDIIGLYKDILYLDDKLDIEGISYKDTYKVKRFLNGYKLRLNKRIKDIFNYLNLDLSILNKKIYELPSTTYKYVMLAYLLLKNKRFIIFDYFDAGLTYKEQKKLIKIIKQLKEDGFQIIVVSNNIKFLSFCVDKIEIINEDGSLFYGDIKDLFNNIDYIKHVDIINFIYKANELGAKLSYTFDRNELIKDIYRSLT